MKTMKNITRINNLDSFNSEIDKLNMDIKTIKEVNRNKDLKKIFDKDSENKEEKQLKENEEKKEQSIILNTEEIEIKKKDDNIDEKLKKIDISMIKTLKEFSYENSENKIDSSKNNDNNNEEDI